MSEHDNGSGRTGRGRPRAAEGGDRRARIIDCALELFAEKGISATTDAAVASAAGVTAAMIHYYFKNREGLLDALVAERLTPRMRYIWEGFDGEIPANPREIVRTVVGRMFEVVAELPMLPALWNREVFNVEGRLRERVLANLPREPVGRAFRALSNARDAGLLNRRLVPELVIISALSLVMVPLAAENAVTEITGRPLVREELAAHVLALLDGGVCGAEGNGGER